MKTGYWLILTFVLLSSSPIWANPSGDIEVLFDLEFQPGAPTAIHAGEQTDFVVHVYTNYGSSLPGLLVNIAATGALIDDQSAIVQRVTDSQGRIEFFVRAPCDEAPQDILVSAYPVDLGSEVTQSVTVTALGGNQVILTVPPEEVTAANGAPLWIDCSLYDSCGDPVMDTIEVDHQNGVASVDWLSPGEFRVTIDTTGAPITGYRETITIRTGGGLSADVDVRVLSKFYTVLELHPSTASLGPGDQVSICARVMTNLGTPVAFEETTIRLLDAAYGSLNGGDSASGMTNSSGEFCAVYTAPEGISEDVVQRITAFSSSVEESEVTPAEFGLTAITDFNYSWMYLSTRTDRYESGMYEAQWASGSKMCYIIVKNPDSNWSHGDAYSGLEFSVDYSPALFNVGATSPQAPQPLLIGGCTDGHCSYGVGTGGQVTNNPWIAVALEFLNFSAGDNLYFLLGPSDNPSSVANGGPAWAYFDPNNPPVYRPDAPAYGYGEEHVPTWKAGLVLLNYNPQTIAPWLIEELEQRVQHPGHPLWMEAVPTDSDSWGALKSRFGQE